MFRVLNIYSIITMVTFLNYSTLSYSQIITAHRAYIDIRNITAPDSTVGPECKKENGLLNGTCRTFWPGGKIKSEGFYKNDSISGKYKTWYNDGVLSEEWSLNPDNKNGLRIFYWQNGNKELQTFFENGTIIEQKHWNENGAFILHELIMDSSIIRSTAYHNNGLIKYSGSLKGGERSGLWRFYNEQGELCGIKEYDNGELVEEKKHCP